MNSSDKYSAEDQLDNPIDTIDHWSRRRQQLGVIVWSSFLAACFASLLFFAFIDPAQIVEESSPRWWLPNAMTGYAVGFMFFWIVCAVAAMLTSYLLETAPSHSRSDHMPDNSGVSGRPRS
jgi:hypothetical protein